MKQLTEHERLVLPTDATGLIPIHLGMIHASKHSMELPPVSEGHAS